MARRVLITGGSGFLGTNLVEHYRVHADEVLNLDPKPPRDPSHRPLWQQLEPLDRAGTLAAVRSFAPTDILHMGARTDLAGASAEDYAANTKGVELLIDAIRVTPSIERVIFASSRMVCRIGYQPTRDDDYCPTTAYGMSKVEGERIVRAARLDPVWTIVRPTSIWGPWFDVPYRDFFLAIARGRYVNVRGRRIAKSFGYVENTVYELDRLLSAPADSVGGATLYLADYPPLDVADWAETIRRELGASPIRTVPLPALRLVARAGDLVESIAQRPAPLTSFRLANLLTPMVHDLSALEGVVGALPVATGEGVRRTVDWLRAQHLV
jgi:nucleoside-diphosphate-sugar epimerase